MPVYLITITVAWVISQGAKYLIASMKKGSFRDLRLLYMSGGMPSVHSALVASILPVVGVFEGVDSAVFAIAALLAVIVMYDSLTVRRSSGEQGVAIKSLIARIKSRDSLPYTAMGHTPAEVAAGACLGLAVGVAASIIAG